MSGDVVHWTRLLHIEILGFMITQFLFKYNADHIFVA